jgi:polysaccharide export outer membrane protein
MTKAAKSVWLILAAVLTFVVPAAAAEYAPAYSAADYHLGAGDKVRVTVFNEADLSGEFQVDAMGYLRLPMVGQVKAGGLAARDVEANIRSALADGYLNDPRVAVEITAYRPFYIVGEVQKPGEYPYANGMTASTAVAVAGGYTPKAVSSVIYVRHLGENAEHRLAATDATPIVPGDTVRVDSTPFWDVLDVLAPIAGVSALRYVIQ